MNISKLYDELQDKFLLDDLNGEISLHGNCIIWNYFLQEIEEQSLESFDDEDGIIESTFNSMSSEEQLQDAYNEDIEMLKEFLDKIEETDNWSFSDADILDESISFKIF